MVSRFSPSVKSNNGFGRGVQETGRAFGSQFGGGRASSQQGMQQKPPNRSFNPHARWGSSFKPGYQMASYFAKASMPDYSLADMGGGGGGGPATTTGDAVDQANPFVNKASAQYGVPAAFLKAIIVRESSGNWGRDGSRYVDIGRAGAGGILPYVGIFESTWGSWGCAGTAAGARGNQQAQVDCLAKGMKGWYDNPRSGGSWKNVAAIHFSGKPYPNNFVDENGMSTEQYVTSFMKDMERFGGASSSGGGGGASGGVSTVWGGKGDRDLSYGYNAPNNLGFYRYSTAYGMDGSGHTGIDIPDAAEAPIYTPAGGKVVCACTGSNGGCEQFRDVMGKGCGRVEVELDNGHRIIFGHVSTSAFKIGDRVNAGQQVATVGGMNGFHTHLEYRIPDSSQSSGFRIVDPNQYLGGGAIATSGAEAGGAAMGSGLFKTGYNYRPRETFTGSRGYSGYGGSRAYGQRKQGMNNVWGPR